MPRVAGIYKFLMNTWYILPDSYQQSAYKNTVAIVTRQIQQVENPQPAVVISVDAACIDNAICFDYLTSKVAPEESEIGSTDPNIPVDNNCTHDELPFVMPGDSGDYDDEGDKSAKPEAIPTAS
jgi:hypothetical protein